jgi:hypothetical protein
MNIAFLHFIFLDGHESCSDDEHNLCTLMVPIIIQQIC